MYGLFIIIAALMIGAFCVAYWQMRKEHPEAIGRFEHRVGKFAAATARATGKAAKQGSRSAATAVAERAERARQANQPLRWIGSAETLTVYGFTVPSPLTYAGNPQRGWFDEPSAIDLKAPLHRSNSATCAPLSYWPRYDQMSPEQRHVYLSWMCTGRRRMPREIGYAFVFFYGLERRALVDNRDHQLIATEVGRLRRIHGQEPSSFSRSFENYTSGFLWFLVASRPEMFVLESIQELMQSVRYWGENELAAATGWFAHHRLPLPDWAALIVARELPESRRSVVTQRVEDKFCELFTRRYREQFGSGMELSAAKRPRRHIYRTASAVIGVCECEAGDPMGRVSQFKPIVKIWNQCIDDLQKLNKVVRNEEPADELTPAAWEALPEELRSGTDHPLTSPFCDLVSKNCDEDGHSHVPIADLASILEIDERDRFTPTQSRWMCATAEFVGYGLEPDARLTGRSYKADEEVVAFLRITDEATDPRRYKAAACMLRLGLGLAASDGHVHPSEVALVVGDIERWFDLNDEEQRRIEALRTHLLRQGADLKGLKRISGDLDATQRRAVAQLLLALIAEDGVITKEEIRAVRKCYRALEIDEQEVDAALERWRHLVGDEPVTVKTAAPQRRGERIQPAPADTEGGFKLNRTAIEAIERESREVAVILAVAMSVVEESADASSPETAIELDPFVTMTGKHGAPGEGRFDGSDPSGSTPRVEIEPPSRYLDFYRTIVCKPVWRSDDAEAVAREHGLMLHGAIEAINDWSFERLGGQVLYEDGGEIHVERDLIDEAQQ